MAFLYIRRCGSDSCFDSSLSEVQGEYSEGSCASAASCVVADIVAGVYCICFCESQGEKVAVCRGEGVYTVFCLHSCYDRDRGIGSFSVICRLMAGCLM